MNFIGTIFAVSLILNVMMGIAIFSRGPQNRWKIEDKHYQTVKEYFYQGCFKGTKFEKGPPTTGFNTNTPGFWCTDRFNEIEHSIEMSAHNLFWDWK